MGHQSPEINEADLTATLRESRSRWISASDETVKAFELIAFIARKMCSLLLLVCHGPYVSLATDLICSILAREDAIRVKKLVAFSQGKRQYEAKATDAPEPSQRSVDSFTAVCFF